MSKGWILATKIVVVAYIVGWVTHLAGLALGADVRKVA